MQENYCHTLLFCSYSLNLILLAGRVINEENLFLAPPVIPTTQPPSTLGPSASPATEAPTVAPTEDDWEPIFLDQLNFTDDQMMLCGDNIQCLFDLNVTDEMDLAMTTLNHSVETEETREEIGELCIIIFDQ